MHATMFSILQKLGFQPCSWCDKLTRSKHLCKSCTIAEDKYWVEELARREAVDIAGMDAHHMQVILDDFCSHYGCWDEVRHTDGKCDKHSANEDDAYPEHDQYDDRDDEDDDYVSSAGIYSRALAHFGGNTELAHEAATLFPGDWI